MKNTIKTRAADKVRESGFESLNAKELKAYSHINWSFESHERYEEARKKLVHWAKENLKTQKLFDTEQEFIKVVNKIIHKYKKAERNRILFEKWDILMEDKEVEVATEIKVDTRINNNDEDEDVLKDLGL